MDKNQLLNNIVKNSPCGIFVVNKHGDIVFSIPKSSVIFGYAEQECLVGKNIKQLMEKESYIFGLQNIDKVFNGKKTDSTIYQLIKKDGSFFMAKLVPII